MTRTGALALWLIAAQTTPAPVQTLEVTHTARAMTPGEVARVTVRPTTAAVDPRGHMARPDGNVLRGHERFVAGPGTHRSRHAGRHLHLTPHGAHARWTRDRAAAPDAGPSAHVPEPPHHRRRKVRDAAGRRAAAHRTGTGADRCDLHHDDTGTILERSIRRAGARHVDEQLRAPVDRQRPAAQPALRH